MSVWLPIIAFVVGTWAGFFVACLMCSASQDCPYVEDGEED